MKKIYTFLFLCLGFQLIGQIENDNCIDAFPIGEVTDLDFVTAGATTDGPLHIDSPCPSNTEPEIDSIYNDVWYLYTPSFTGNALFTTCGTADFDTKIAAYNPGSACPPVDEDLLSCNEDGSNCAESTSELIFPVMEGESYLLRIGGYGEMPPGLSGQGTFSVSEFVSIVENDFCNDAIEITAGTGYNLDNFGAITDGPIHDDSNPCFQFGDPTIMADIWYSFTPDFTGSVLWSTCGTVTFDTRLGVYGPNADCNNLSTDDLYACNDDGAGCPDYSSSLFFDVEEGQTYLLRLGGWNGATGNGTFDLINQAAPDPPANDMCDNAIETTVLEPGSTETTDGTTIAASFDPAEFVFPPCIGNTNGGEFAEVWYSFNSGEYDEIALNLFSLTPEASYYVDVWENCSTPTDTLSFLDNCTFLNGDSSLIISDVFGEFELSTDYLLRLSTRLTSDTPGDFSFQLIGVEPSSIENPDALGGDITLLPNPASSFINLKIPLSQSSDLSYTVSDIIGKTILNEQLGMFGAGDHLQQVDINQLNPGVYFINIFFDDQPVAIRFVKE